MAWGVPFFLFAPYLTCLQTGKPDVCHIITEAQIIYDNGAKVSTCFVTNLDPYLVRTCPDLNQKLDKANRENLDRIKKHPPKYKYPVEVLTSTMCGYMAKHGIEYRLRKEDAMFICSLESQRQKKKGIFGGGYLLSEKAAAEKADAIKWELSDDEKEMIKRLGEKHGSM